jgi:hypothetical protein
MTAAEALALHNQVHGIQQQLLTALADPTPDMDVCFALVTQIDDLLGQVLPVESLTHMSEEIRDQLLQAAKTTAHLLLSYRDIVLHLRHQQTATQVQAERDNQAVRGYQQQLPADKPQYLDEKR